LGEILWLGEEAKIRPLLKNKKSPAINHHNSLAINSKTLAQNLAQSSRNWHRKKSFGENSGERKKNPSANPATST